MSRSTQTAPNAETVESVALFEELVSAYKAATDAKARAAVRKQCESGRDTALRALDLPTAQRYLATLDALRVDAAPKAESVPVEITLATRAAVLRMAAEMIESGDARPDGLEFDGDLPTVEITDEIRDAATKLAGSKITRSVERHSIAEVIVRAFADEEPGTVLAISKVRQQGKIDGYTPSPGAIRAHLESDNPVEGYELVEKTVDAPYSVRYVG